MKGKKHNKTFKTFSVLLNLFLLAGCASLPMTSEGKFNRARSFYRHGDKDSAFFELRRIARDDTNPLLAWKAQFGMGEYYFDNHVTEEAKNCFLAHLGNRDLSSSKDISLALARLYLYKISRPETETIPEEIKSEFFNKPLFLLFSEYKYRKYISPLGHKYEMREYPDKVEVYLDGKPFQTLTP